MSVSMLMSCAYAVSASSKCGITVTVQRREPETLSQADRHFVPHPTLIILLKALDTGADVD
jgi:hypothetical protein